jgi:hypothetical protein
MNRGKKTMTVKNKKKQTKEVLHSSNAVQAEELTKQEKGPSTWKILAKFPPKVATKGKEQLTSFQKGMKVKKKTHASKHSKRSTPGQVEEDTTPYKHIKREDKKDRQNIQKQIVTQTRRVTKKLSKKK